MKRCTKCKKRRDESKFRKRPRCKDGLGYWCKDCEREYNRSRYRKKTGGRSRKYRSYDESHRVVDGVTEKQCSRCKRWKPGSEFYKQLYTKDKLTVCCKKCVDKATNLCRKRRTAAVAEARK